MHQTLMDFIRSQGLTSTRVAADVGIDDSAIRRISSRKANPSFPVAYRLAQRLGITMEDLYDLLGDKAS